MSVCTRFIRCGRVLLSVLEGACPAAGTIVPGRMKRVPAPLAKPSAFRSAAGTIELIVSQQAAAVAAWNGSVIRGFAPAAGHKI